MEQRPIGFVAQPFPIEIELGKVTEFARATKARMVDWGQPGHPVPPTFLITMALWMSEANAILDPSGEQGRALHGEHEVVFGSEGPPRVGDSLTGQQRLEDRYEKVGRRAGRMTMSLVATNFTGADGSHVATIRRTRIVTDQAVPKK